MTFISSQTESCFKFILILIPFKFLLQIRHIVTNFCLEKPTRKTIRNQPSGMASVAECNSNSNLMQIFVMAYDSNNSSVGTIATDESVCLDISSQSNSEMKPKVHIVACSGSDSQKWMYDIEVTWTNYYFSAHRRWNILDLLLKQFQNESLKHLSSQLCAEVPVDEMSLVLNECSINAYQKWKFESVPWIWDTIVENLSPFLGYEIL